MATGSVEALYIAPDSGDPMEPTNEIEAVADRGLRGDRYFEDSGLWNQIDEDYDRNGASDITFIEVEALEALERDAGIDLDAGAHRRNVTTRNVALNHLVGKRFEVGEITCEGVQLCEPCGYMQSLVGEEGLAAALTHRGGLDARIVESGRLAVGDEIRW